METSRVRIMCESPTPRPPCDGEWTNLELVTMEYLENGQYPVGDADGNEESGEEKVDQQKHWDSLQTWNMAKI